MTGLLTLQTTFQEHLLQLETDIFNYIINTENVPADVRLSIYSHAYRSRLLEALASNYPILQIYLGSEQFDMLGNSYIDRYPSHFRSIRWFGDQLENFLRENIPYSDFPYLSELAKVEWTMTVVFDAADSTLINLENLGSIPPECWVDMRLLAHPSAHLIQLSWNVVPIWQALCEDESPPELFQSDTTTSWIFWRSNLINQYCSLTNDEASAFAVMLKGSTFGDICDVLCQFLDEKDVALRAASLLNGWISAGLISEIIYHVNDNSDCAQTTIKTTLSTQNHESS